MEQSGGEAVDLARIVDGQDMAAGGQRTTGLQGQGLMRRVDPGPGGHPVDPGPLDAQLQGVQRHAADLPKGLDADRFGPREGQPLEVGSDVDAVADGLDVARQSQGRARLAGRSLRRGTGRCGLRRGLGAAGEAKDQAAEKNKDRTHGRG